MDRNRGLFACLFGLFWGKSGVLMKKKKSSQDSVPFFSNQSEWGLAKYPFCTS